MRLKWIIIIGLCVVVVALVAELVPWYIHSRRPPEPPMTEELRVQRKRMRLHEELRALIGLSKEEVKAKRGTPARINEAVWSDQPFWGPGEGLGRILSTGQPYDEWTWTDGQYTFIVWFAEPKEGEPDRSKWKAIDVAVHHQSMRY